MNFIRKKFGDMGMGIEEQQIAEKNANYEAGSLLDQIMEETNLRPEEESYDIARHGVETFIADMLKSGQIEERINRVRVDKMISELDNLNAVGTMRAHVNDLHGLFSILKNLLSLSNLPSPSLYP